MKFCLEAAGKYSEEFTVELLYWENYCPIKGHGSSDTPNIGSF
jgi:hypothetical protein